jgi:hypothetical protein
MLAHFLDAERTRQPERFVLDEALDVLPADQRQEIAELLTIKVVQQCAVAGFFRRHFLENFGGDGILFAQSIRKAMVDTLVFFLGGDSQRQKLLFSEIGKALHDGPRF